MKYFLDAGERFCIITIQNLLLVHIHDIELIRAAREASLVVRLPRDLEEEPVAVTFRIGIGFQVKVKFARLHL